MFNKRHQRGFYTPLTGLSMLEILISISIIGILMWLLTPNLTQVYQEAVRQTVRQQTKVVEKSLADWYSAQPNFATANAAWNNTFGGTGGWANPVALMTQNYLLGYMNTNQVTGASNYTITTSSVYTPEMQRAEVTETDPALDKFIGGDANVGLASDGTMLTHAHLRFYWTPDNPATDNINERKSSAPKVILFLPSLKNTP